jgi:hypothetical protein
VTLQAVFLEWMDRLSKCIATNGEHAEWSQIHITEQWSFILLILKCSCLGGTACARARSPSIFYLISRFLNCLYQGIDYDSASGSSHYRGIYTFLR